MQRKFVTNLLFIISLNLLVKPFWIFGIDRTVQNMVGAESYGFYISLFNFSLILNVLLDLGLQNYNNRNIAQHHQLMSKYLSNIVMLKILLAIFYTLVCIITGIIIGYDFKQFSLLFFLIFNQFLLSFILYLRTNISGLQLFRLDSFLSVLDKLLMIIICSILLWGNFTRQTFRIEWFVYSQSIAYLITTLIILSIVLSKAEFFRLRFDYNYIRAILKQTLPYAVLVLIMASYNRIDSVMIERMLPDGKVQAGIYAQAFRILDALSNFGFLFAGLLLPMFSKMIKQNDSIIKLLRLSSMLILIPALILSVSSSFFSSEIMSLLYHEHVSVSSSLLSLLMFSYVAISVSYIFGTLLTAGGNLRQLNTVALIGLLINVILNFVLIPELKAKGSAIASLVTQLVTTLAQVLIAVKVFHLRTNYKLIFQILFFTLSLIFLSYLFSVINFYWLSKFAILLFCGSLLAFAFKLINFHSIHQIIWYNNEKIEKID